MQRQLVTVGDCTNEMNPFLFGCTGCRPIGIQDVAEGFPVRLRVEWLESFCRAHGENNAVSR
jgi:hypothetical protein